MRRSTIQSFPIFFNAEYYSEIVLPIFISKGFNLFKKLFLPGHLIDLLQNILTFTALCCLAFFEMCCCSIIQNYILKSYNFFLFNHLMRFLCSIVTKISVCCVLSLYLHFTQPPDSFRVGVVHMLCSSDMMMRAVVIIS